MKYAIAIIGATASGKTAVSLELSQKIPSEIISADSRQIYRYLDIGTAKPTVDERTQCTHHFIDICNPDEPYSAGLFAEQASRVVENIIGRENIPLIVGGSGLYVQALCEGISTEESIDFSAARIKTKQLYDELGRERFYDYVMTIDKESACKYDDKNPQRLIRTAEYYIATGKKFSDFHKIPKTVPNFKTLYFGIHHEREELYNTINKRCEFMWNNGIFEETEKVLSMGYNQIIQSLNTVGYKEVIAVMNGKYKSDDGLELMKQSTRRYAKRQLTWCRNQTNIMWLEPTTAANNILEKLNTIL